MNIKVLAVSKRAKDQFAELEQDYLKRMKPYCKIELVSVPPVKENRAQSKEVFQRAEAAAINEKIKRGDFVIVLDESGKQLSSMELAHVIDKECIAGHSSFTFCIGGAFGWPKEFLARADMVLSLSRLTFPHKLAHLVLVEQIYRVLTILNGTPYHK